MQVLEWFQDEVFEQGTIVTGATSKVAAVLYDLFESGFKQRISVGEMVSKSREEVI